MKCLFCGEVIHPPKIKWCDRSCANKHRYRNNKGLREKIKQSALKRYHTNKTECNKKSAEYQRKRYNSDLKYREYRITKRVHANQIPLKNKCCENCGSNQNLHRHHENYNRKERKIKILCKDCHAKVHFSL